MKLSSVGLCIGLICVLLSSFPASAEVLRCVNTAGALLWTDEEQCPYGYQEDATAAPFTDRGFSATVGAEALDQQRRALQQYQSGQAPQRRLRQSAPPSPPTKRPDAGVCESLLAKEQAINARMRLGYTAREGERLHQSWRQIEAQRCQAGCLHC